MNNKTILLLGILVIFLTLGCVSAADDDTYTITSTELLTTTASDDVILTSNAVDLDNPSYYNITEDTYSTYFDENGTFTVTPSAGENIVVQIGTITGKNFIFNDPIALITPLDSTSTITDGSIKLNNGAEGTTIDGLTISLNKDDSVVIENFASDVSILNNIISLTGSAVYNFAAIMVHDSDNVKIINNTITLNATGQYAYAIDLYTNYVENATISNAVVSGNTINGVMDGTYMAGISAMNGVTYSNITDNTVNIVATNITYGIATAKNYANAAKSGNLIIKDNVVSLDSDMAYGIELASQIDNIVANNEITLNGNGVVGIGAIGIENTEVTENTINLVGGTLTNSYWDSVPNGESGILVVGEETNNKFTNNVITGTNVNGISIAGSEDTISGNIINLTSDENIAVSSYGSSMVMGIESTGSENTIEGNDVTVTGPATYNYGIDVYSYPDSISDVKINNNTVSVDSDSNYGAAIYTSNLEDSEITNNVVNAGSEGMAYGIALDTGVNTVIDNNDVTVDGSNTRAIEVTGSNGLTVTNNDVEASGDAVYGFAASGLTDSTVTGNDIATTAGNLDDAYKGYDMIPAGQAGTYVTGSDNDVSDNNLTGLTNAVSSSNLKAENTTITEGAGESFTTLLLDASGKPIVGQHVSINLTRVSNGLSKTYDLVSDYEGKLSIPINLAQGEYTAKLSYDGLTFGDNTYLAGESDTVTITVGDGRVATSIAVSPMSKNYGDDTPFTGTLTTSSGSPLAGQHVKITLSRFTGESKTYDVTTDYTGLASLPINLGQGSYLGQIAYEGTDAYLPSESAMVSISVF